MAVVKINTPGTKGFLQWVKLALPKTYAGMRNELSTARGLSAPDPAAVAAPTATSASWVDTFKEIANVAAQGYLTTQQIKAQQQIMTLQLQRAQAGLPPLAIDPTTYGLPQPSFGVSLDSGTKKILIFGGIGLALALMLGLIGGGRAARRT